MAWGSQDGATYLAHFDTMMSRVHKAGGETSGMAENYAQPIITLLTPLFGIPLAKEKIWEWVASTLEVEVKVPEGTVDWTAVVEEGVEEAPLMDSWQMVPSDIFDDPEAMPMGADLEVIDHLISLPEMQRFLKQSAKMWANNPFRGLFTPTENNSVPEPVTTN